MNSIEDAGSVFQEELFERFRCTQYRYVDIYCNECESRSRHAGGLDEAGEAFLRQLLKHFHGEAAAFHSARPDLMQVED